MYLFAVRSHRCSVLSDWIHLKNLMGEVLEVTPFVFDLLQMKDVTKDYSQDISSDGTFRLYSRFYESQKKQKERKQYTSQIPIEAVTK